MDKDDHLTYLGDTQVTDHLASQPSANPAALDPDTLALLHKDKEKKVQRKAVNNEVAAPGSIGVRKFDPMAAKNGKQQIIFKLRGQNEKLKKELSTLTSELEKYVEKTRQKKHK